MPASPQSICRTGLETMLQSLTTAGGASLAAVYSNYPDFDNLIGKVACWIEREESEAPINPEYGGATNAIVKFSYAFTIKLAVWVVDESGTTFDDAAALEDDYSGAIELALAQYITGNVSPTTSGIKLFKTTLGNMKPEWINSRGNRLLRLYSYPVTFNHRITTSYLNYQ